MVHSLTSRRNSRAPLCEITYLIIIIKTRASMCVGLNIEGRCTFDCNSQEIVSRFLISQWHMTAGLTSRACYIYSYCKWWLWYANSTISSLRLVFLQFRERQALDLLVAFVTIAQGTAYYTRSLSYEITERFSARINFIRYRREVGKNLTSKSKRKAETNENIKYDI